MEIRLNKKENLYFIIKAIITPVIIGIVVFYFSSLFQIYNPALVSSIIVFVFYAVFIWGFLFFQKIYLVAYLKGNGVEISERQFPEMYEQYKNMVADLQVKQIPKLFIIQQGGILNAFAVRFSGKNYIAIYSEIFSLISSDIDAVRFVIGHELGHVKRNHMSKRFWTFPSSIIPFLTASYSRSCEYTCDNIGNNFANNNPMNGLLVLAAGNDLYTKINMENYIEDAKINNTFAVKFMGLFMSHPYLPKRFSNLKIK